MDSQQPARVVYCEGNVDGTIGGSYYSLLYLVKGLDRRRFEPLVVFHAENGLLPRFHEAGIETVVWPRIPPATFAERVPALRPVQQAVNIGRGYLWQAAAQAMFLRRRGVRIVHLNNSVVRNHEWMLAARLAGLPCVTHERGINDHYPSAARYWAKRLEAVVCISDAVRQTLEKHGLDNGNLVTIHNALDPAEVKFRQSPSELRAAHGIPAAAPVLVMTGNLKAWKGQETVIRAMAQVHRTHPEARCLLVGATSPLDRDFEVSMRSLVSEFGLDEHVLFAGYRSNAADYMQMADVVLHASVLPEPFGRVALEAMACRKPVIGSDAGGIPEIVEAGRTGCTFPPGDAVRLAEAITWMLDHPDEAARMGERGYTRLVERFPISVNVRATEHIYDRLLARGAAGHDRLSLVNEERNAK
jgi:glycosyltransferase involved in cell wall biosynthesis